MLGQTRPNQTREP